MELQNQIALVTGGGGGIGRAICLLLAKEGAAIAVVDIAGSLAEGVAREIVQAGGRARAYPCDVTQHRAVVDTVEQVEAQLGPTDVLVNCAGGSIYSLVTDMEESLWDRVVDLNLKGVYLCSRAVLPGMLARRRGTIINISSNYGITGSVGRAHYAAAKAGVIGFTKSLALEVAASGLRVNAVAPGRTNTQRVRGRYSPEQWEAMGRAVPLGRAAEPEEVAEGVLFLASERARFITGQTLHVNGGMTMP